MAAASSSSSSPSRVCMAAAASSSSSSSRVCMASSSSSSPSRVCMAAAATSSSSASSRVSPRPFPSYLWRRIEKKEPTPLMATKHGDGTAFPPHVPVLYEGLCTKCGSPAAGSAMRIDYVQPRLTGGASVLQSLRAANRARLLREKKLILVLDLDHTLLHCTLIASLSPDEAHLVADAVPFDADVSRGLHRSEDGKRLIKLRPNVRRFLAEAAHLFELYVYTMGTRSYALEITRILDPSQRLFGSRVIAREDCTCKGRKGLDLVLGDERLVAIVDDDYRVWRDKDRRHQIVATPYVFFSSSYRQLHPAGGKSPSESNTDEVDGPDAGLMLLIEFLKKVHQMVFDPVLRVDLDSRSVAHVLDRYREDDNKLVREEQRAEQLAFKCCIHKIDRSTTSDAVYKKVNEIADQSTITNTISEMDVNIIDQSAESHCVVSEEDNKKMVRDQLMAEQLTFKSKVNQVVDHSVTSDTASEKDDEIVDRSITSDPVSSSNTLTHELEGV